MASYSRLVAKKFLGVVRLSGGFADRLGLCRPCRDYIFDYVPVGGSRCLHATQCCLGRLGKLFRFECVPLVEQARENVEIIL